MRAHTCVAALFMKSKPMHHYGRPAWLEVLSALVVVVSLIAVATVIFLSV